MDWILLNKVHQDWISILMFSNLMLLSFIKWRYDRKFTSFFKSIDPSVYFNNYGNNFFFNRFFGASILVFSIVNISLCLILILNSIDLIELNIMSFLIFFSFLLFIGFLSYLINSILGQIFAVKRETLAYIFNNLRFLFRLSIFIFIILVIHYYYFLDTFIFISTSSICVFMFYFLNSIVIIYKFLEHLDKGKLYFILYLCTLKITPWVFMYWFINNI